jgi:hypothetical protein
MFHKNCFGRTRPRFLASSGHAERPSVADHRSWSGRSASIGRARRLAVVARSAQRRPRSFATRIVTGRAGETFPAPSRATTSNV